MIEKHKDYFNEIDQIDISRLQFLDETGCNQAMTPEYARSACGEPAISKVPETRGKQISIIGVIGIEKITDWERFEGPINQFTFILYIEESLSKVWNLDDYLVMDNATIHKTPLVVSTLNKYKIKFIFLPPYHPTLNPIELFWSMLK